MEPTLLILAAGRGSRFGGAKQVTPMGPSGETIMEYSIFDALRSGFGNVVLVINKDVEEDTFKLIDRMGDMKSKVSYAYQDLHTSMIAEEAQKNRLKPWGTAHAIMAAEDKIKGSFAMINADDFYGQEAYQTMSEFLKNNQGAGDYAMVGYDMVNTLSENGAVSRGVSVSDADGFLASIVETHGISEENGAIYCDGPNGERTKINEGLASMNFWGFQQSLFAVLNDGFQEFMKSTPDLTKDEYLIPTVIDDMITSGRAKVSVLHSAARWFGVTYKEDSEPTRAAIRNLVTQGKYPEKLWS